MSAERGLLAGIISDDTPVAQPRDVPRRVPELGQDGVSVLAERGRAVAEAARRLWQIDRRRSEELLNALVVDGLLQRSPSGAYLLSSEPSRWRERTARP